MNRTAVATLVLLLIVVGVLVGMNLERKEVSRTTPPEPEARINRYLAAEMFLDQMGIPAESELGLSEMPASDGLLLLSLEGRTPTIDQADEIVDWIEAGGVLITTPPVTSGIVLEGEEDPLMSALGVEVTSIDTRQSWELEELELDGEYYEARFYSTVGVNWIDGEDPLTSLIYAPRGDGAVVVVCDPRLFTNSWIGDHDHAAILWSASQLRGPRSEARIARGVRAPSLSSLLLDRASVAISLLLAAFAIWCWHASDRFGPLIPNPPFGSRSIVEHVDGIGWFLWSRRRHNALLDAVRDPFLALLAKREPAIKRMTEEEGSEYLAMRTELPVEQVHDALYRVCPDKPREFVRRMRTLKQLRRVL